MKTQELDIYHGIALAQIVRHKSFKAINSGSDKFGHYVINNNCHLLIKYRTNDEEPWTFVFSPEEIEALKEIVKKGDFVFVCLVCGNVTVCALSFEEIQDLLSGKSQVQQSITVKAQPNASLHVRGSQGALDKTIPHNSFPKKLFERT